MNQELKIRNHGRRPGLRRAGGQASRYFKFLIPYSLFIILSIAAPYTQAVTETEQQIGRRGIEGAEDLVNFFAPKLGFTEQTDPPQPEIVAGRIIQGAMGLIGVAFGILIIYGGFLWMTARGNEEQVKKSINILQTAVIGFIVVVGAYAITSYVVDTVITSAFRS